MNTYKNELSRITNIFLEPEDNYPELLNAANDYYQLLLSAASLESQPLDEIAASQTPAQNPAKSDYFSMRIKDIMRTKRFIAGIFKAVREAHKRFPSTKLHILYIGVDPFASLALPLTTSFGSSDISFTFLTDREYAVECLKNLSGAFDIKDYINDIKYCDPTTYRTDSVVPIHMIINEMMDFALQKEPQVGITLNLAPQLLDGGILIPEVISIEAGLVNPRRLNERMQGINLEDKDHILMIKEIFELNKDIHRLNPSYNGEDNSHTFPEQEIVLPQNISEEYRYLCLFTTIQVFGGEYLTHWQSALNTPKAILELDSKKAPAKKISFQYVISSNPGFRYKMVW